MSATTIRSALADARARGVDRLDAQLLLAHLLGRSRAWVIAHDERVLDATERARWEALVSRRAQGVPVAQLVGGKEFRGLWLTIDQHVLVPRPETELLVERALAAPAMRSAAPRVVDLGTGSGAIALAVKAERPGARVHASDIDAAALAVARGNAERLALEVEFRAGSWWVPWHDAAFDVAVANPPYVAAGDPHLDALTHEPVRALVGGADGLEALRAIVADAPAHLRPGGELWLEHGHDQGAVVRELLAAAFEGIETHRDLAGVERVTGGRRV